MNINVDHLAFRVTNVDKVADLFKQLGYVEVRRTDHHGGAVELENPAQPGLVLEFTTLRADRNQVPGFDHCGLHLDSKEVLDQLLAGDFPAKDAPKKVPETGRWTSNWYDNDGIKWQFTV